MNFTHCPNISIADFEQMAVAKKNIWKDKSCFEIWDFIIIKIPRLVEIDIQQE